MHKSIPLLHITDLYHPPQDPDDQVDLATVYALNEYDLLAVVLDVTEKFLGASPEGFDISRDPGYVLVTQLSHLTQRAVPVSVGPRRPMSSVSTSIQEIDTADRGGVMLILDILRAAGQPMVVSIVGSARPLAIAFNTDPELVRAKVERVLLNAGSSGGDHVEWNVGLDPNAYIALWQSGLPIDWYPCTTDRSPFDPEHEHGTHFTIGHRDLLNGLSPALQAWFAYGFSGSTRADVIAVLNAPPARASWEHILDSKRSMWATASLVMGAGRKLAKIDDTWQFVSAQTDSDDETWKMTLDPIEAHISQDTRVTWSNSRSGPHRIFRRTPGRAFGVAIGEALNNLLRTLVQSST